MVQQGGPKLNSVLWLGGRKVGGTLHGKRPLYRLPKEGTR